MGSITGTEIQQIRFKKFVSQFLLPAKKIRLLVLVPEANKFDDFAMPTTRTKNTR
jgi:hypothetical protein